MMLFLCHFSLNECSLITAGLLAVEEIVSPADVTMFDIYISEEKISIPVIMPKQVDAKRAYIIKSLYVS